MGVFDSFLRKHNEGMSDASFLAMAFFFKVADFLGPNIGERISKFNIQPGMTVVDYGCGPGRYTMPIAGIVGGNGLVFAVDLQKLAIAQVQKRAEKSGLSNIKTSLAEGYSSGVSDQVADVVCALDMFFGVRNPNEFLAEIKRIIKKGGILIIDDGHQSRAQTKDKLAASGMWEIVEESADHLKCRVKL